MTNDPLAQELLDMARADQAYRLGWFTHRNSPQYATGRDKLDQKHTAILKSIVATIGWPTTASVGPAASHAAWLLVQHASHDYDFQAHCLDLMKQSPEGTLDKRQLAYLTDKIRVHEGKPQLYGTQYKSSPEKFLHPLPIEDAGRVNDRRAEYGLAPMDLVYDVAAMEQAEKSGKVTHFSSLEGYKKKV